MSNNTTNTDVNWSANGNNNINTFIDSNGLLTVETKLNSKAKNL